MNQRQDNLTRPVPNLQRKAALVRGGAKDHKSDARIHPIANFDLDKTIFGTLKGKLPRYIMTARIGKETSWSRGAQEEIESQYEKVHDNHPLPDLNPELLAFLRDECDFDAEHADGSFLEHLYFCYEYGELHYPERSALVLFLHSVLGTGTNTFAMAKEKIPKLRALLSDFDWRHVEAFPSTLRLLYDLPLRRELRANVTRLKSLKEIRMQRVIDNAPIVMSGEDFVIQLNYQLVHLLDFLPVADWARNRSDTSFIIFRDLYDLMERAGIREAQLAYTPSTDRWIDGKVVGLAPLIASVLPAPLSERLAAKQVRRFSQEIGHDIRYTLTW